MKNCAAAIYDFFDSQNKYRTPPWSYPIRWQKAAGAFLTIRIRNYSATKALSQRLMRIWRTRHKSTE